ncbi:unnamed protein product, partial [Ectocarpus sp. 8 AP-2014]
MHACIPNYNSSRINHRSAGGREAQRRSSFFEMSNQDPVVTTLTNDHVTASRGVRTRLATPVTTRRTSQNTMIARRLSLGQQAERKRQNNARKNKSLTTAFRVHLDCERMYK